MSKTAIEVITSVQRLGRWSAAEKERLVAASLEPGSGVSAVARKAGIHPSQLYGWRAAAMPASAATWLSISRTTCVARCGAKSRTPATAT
jgi:transposase-like protein